jgi:hypothetical protein
MPGVERAKADRSQQAIADDFQDGRPVLWIEHWMRQRHRQHLVGPARSVVAVRPVDHVEQVSRRRRPESPIEVFVGLCRSGIERGRSRRIPARRCQSAVNRSALYHSALISTALPRRGVTTQSPILASIQVS